MRQGKRTMRHDVIHQVRYAIQVSSAGQGRQLYKPGAAATRPAGTTMHGAGRAGASHSLISQQRRSHTIQNVPSDSVMEE